MGGLMGMAGGMGGGYGGLISGAMGLLGGILSGSQKGPQLQQMALPDVTNAQTDFLKQGANLPSVEQTVQEANDLSNRMFQGNIAKFAPEVMATNQQIGRNAALESAGELPFGQGSGYNGRNLTPRDLGLTSDDIMSQGVGMAGSALQGARALNPFEHTATDTLLSPGALQARSDAQAYQANQIANEQALIRAKANSINPIMSGISGFTGSLLGGMGGMFGSQRGGSSSGGMMSMLGGVGGGGGGFG